MLAIDTNLVVRYLTGDHPRQSARARALIDGEPVFVAFTVMLEVDWVLRSAYGFAHTDEEKMKVATALDRAEHGMDFADALHLGRSLHCQGFATFDRGLVKAARASGHRDVREA